MTSVSHGKPCAGNPHARFEEGASAPESPRRNALLHKKMLVLFGFVAVLVGAVHGDRYTGEHPHGAEWGLVEALHPLDDYGIFRKMPDGMRSGGTSSGVRTGVSIVGCEDDLVESA